jgi:ribonuclease T2
MRRVAVLIWLLVALPAAADRDRAGAFDYWVLSLSWSPSWCALEGDARGAPQCETDLGWGLHGLWPQYDRGWPSWCTTTKRPPSRPTIAAMADIMGSPGLAGHQWRKHGACSGLSAQAYFALSRQAYAAVNRPPLLRALGRPVSLPASVIEEAFLAANPGWAPDMLTITCRSGRIQEARLCLSRDGLDPVPCGRDVLRDCDLPDAVFPPIR